MGQLQLCRPCHVTLPYGHCHANPLLPKARTPLGAGQAGGWYLSLAVRERGQSANLGVPISRGEFAVLRALANVRPAARLRRCRSCCSMSTWIFCVSPQLTSMESSIIVMSGRNVCSCRKCGHLSRHKLDVGHCGTWFACGHAWFGEDPRRGMWFACGHAWLGEVPRHTVLFQGCLYHVRCAPWRGLVQGRRMRCSHV